jgi:GH24 family phage-related lysozyme (muramidase)
MALSSASLKLILRFEVGGGQSYYDKRLKSPTWPGEASGVTIGVGYDLGYYEQKTIQADWEDYLAPKDLKRLLACAGKKGKDAEKAVKPVADLVIDWDDALAVFKNTTISTFWRKTKTAFPGVESLHPNARGALLSLVFNRGTSLVGERRREMAAIKELVPQRDYEAIADQLEAMKRIWVGTPIAEGMNRRRDAEAALVRTALRS